MIVETKDMSRPRVVVPDEVAAREVRGAPRGYHVASCARCGGTSAGYSVPEVKAGELWICEGCVVRAQESRCRISVAELKAAGVEVHAPPERVYADAVADDIEWELTTDGRTVSACCVVCGDPAGARLGGIKVGEERFCRRCLGETGPWNVA